MTFFHDTSRNLLIYPLSASAPLHALPDARRINGQFFAVPRTLQNSQVLRFYNYPVAPVMDGYDWPAAPGVKPYATQKLAAEFMVLHRRCFNLSDMGCVGGETLIDTLRGKQRIDMLAESAKPFVVRTITSEGPRFVEVRPPFIKGRAKLYRVTFESGRSIVVTKRHVFLTCDGWTSCENLAVSARLPVFDVYPQQSNWEPCHVKLLPDAHRWSKIALDSSGYSDILFYDAPPLSAANIDQVLPPSLAGALEQCRFEWRTDARGNKCTRTDPSFSDPRSMRRCGARIDQGETGSFLSEFATKQIDSQFHISARYHLFPNRLREAPASQELQLCIPLSAASGSPFDTVTHIAYERDDVYYDMEVPEHENYVAHGLCNHNTGKTLATLWAADYLMRQYPPGEFRALVVAPLSILERVWADAISKNFLGRRRFVVLYGDAAKRRELLKQDADFYIINFDGVGIGAHTRKRLELDGFSADLARREEIRLVVVDEASGYRDASTKRHRIARLVVGKRPYLFLLTGTPTPNAPTDAYGLGKMVNNAFGKSFTTFRNETMVPVSMYKWAPRRDGYDQARRLLSPSIRIGINQVWDGPPITTQQREVPLTTEQKKLMADLKRDLHIMIRNTVSVAMPNEAAARTKFLQIGLGAVYDANHKEHFVDAEPRYAEAEAVIESTSRKVVCFVGLTSVLNLLYKRLSKQWGCVTLNGDVPAKQRSVNIKRFEEDDSVKIIIADPQTTAHGINEFAFVADTALWFSPIEKNELYLQGNKRLNRPGQKYPMTVVQLVSSPLEREIYKRLETNTSLQGVLLDLVQRGEM